MAPSFERQEKIIELINQRQKMTVSELCEALQASPATIRRDLNELDRDKKVQRYHGGVRVRETPDEAELPAEEQEQLLPLTERLGTHADEKERIAKAAADLINDGDVIAMTGGSTNIFLARQLNNLTNLTVVTNSVNIALELDSRIEVILVGGIFRKQSMTLVGPIAEEIFGKIKVDKAFIGVEAIDVQYGITLHHVSEAHSDRLLAQCAEEVIVVGDRSKFGKRLFTEVIPLSSVNRIITNTDLEAATADFIRSQKIVLVQV